MYCDILCHPLTEIGSATASFFYDLRGETKEFQTGMVSAFGRLRALNRTVESATRTVSLIIFKGD